MGDKKSKLKSAIETFAVFGGIGGTIGAVVGFGLSFISLSSLSVGGIIGLSVLAAVMFDNLYTFKGKVLKAAFLLGGLPLGTFMGAGLGVAAGALFPSFMSSGLSATLAGMAIGTLTLNLIIGALFAASYVINK